MGIRKRGRTLLIVEGEHEKNQLFKLIFKCFSEIKIKMDDVWVYGTNIYLLYDDIVKEYGADWAKNGDDIDLPFVISRKLNDKKEINAENKLCYKDDFTNIILVFDYERHDKKFSEEKIIQMQNIFKDAADMGKLYINYPMIESYQHLCHLPDNNYYEYKISVKMQPGKVYKNLVKKETIIGEIVDFYHRVNDLLEQKFDINDEKIRERCIDEILNITEVNGLEEKIQNVLKNIIDAEDLSTAKYQLADWIKKKKYIFLCQTYWKYMRDIFKQIIRHNILKACRIQQEEYEVSPELYKDNFEKVDLDKILKIQNQSSRDIQNGYIWILNTCVFFIADYKFELIT